MPNVYNNSYIYTQTHTPAIAINTIPSSFAVHNQCKLISIFFSTSLLLLSCWLAACFTEFFFYLILLFKEEKEKEEEKEWEIIHLNILCVCDWVAAAFNSLSSCLEMWPKCSIFIQCRHINHAKLTIKQPCGNEWKAKMWREKPSFNHI